MTFTPASSASLAAFVAINLGVVGAIVAGVALASRRAGPAVYVGAAIVGWIAIVSIVVASGAVRARPMPMVPIVVGASLIVAAAFALSPVGRRLATLPLGMLVAFQSFRLPLELVLHAWARGHTIPETMTWTGQNLDVVTGLLAAVVAPVLLARRADASRLSRAIAWMFNAVGIALLLNVLRVATMSSPLPFAWPVEPPLQLAFYLPYAWIVPVCVGGALAGHVVLTRALLRPTSAEAAR